MQRKNFRTNPTLSTRTYFADNGFPSIGKLKTEMQNNLVRKLTYNCIALLTLIYFQGTSQRNLCTCPLLKLKEISTSSTDVLLHYCLPWKNPLMPLIAAFKWFVLFVSLENSIHLLNHKINAKKELQNQSNIVRSDLFCWQWLPINKKT